MLVFIVVLIKTVEKRSGAKLFEFVPPVVIIYFLMMAKRLARQNKASRLLLCHLALYHGGFCDNVGGNGRNFLRDWGGLCFGGDAIASMRAKARIDDKNIEVFTHTKCVRAVINLQKIITLPHQAH